MFFDVRKDAVSAGVVSGNWFSPSGLEVKGQPVLGDWTISRAASGFRI